MNKAPDYKAILSHIAGCIFFIIIFIPATVHAQTRGTVEVVKDPRIDTFAAKRAGLKINGVAAANIVSNNVFRVQIYNGSVRKEAFSVQAKFNSLYPDMRTYISYIEPNFKVRAGDFRTRLEAEKLMQELKGKFTSLFIIEGK